MNFFTPRKTKTKKDKKLSCWLFGNKYSVQIWESYLNKIRSYGVKKISPITPSTPTRLTLEITSREAGIISSICIYYKIVPLRRMYFLVWVGWVCSALWVGFICPHIFRIYLDRTLKFGQSIYCQIINNSCQIQLFIIFSFRFTGGKKKIMSRFFYPS